MKICFINPTTDIRRPIAELMQLLTKKGHETTLLTPEKFDEKLDNSRHFTDLIKNENVIPIQSLYSSRFNYSIPIDFQAYRKYYNALKNNDIVHIWTYFYPYTVKPLFLKKLYNLKTPIILTADTFPGFSFQAPSIENKLLKIGTKLFGKTIFSIPNKITIYSSQVLNFADKMGIDNEKIEVIPTGIFLDDLNQNVSKDYLEKEFGIPKDSITILFVGLLNPRKGVDTLIKVTNKLVKKKLNVTVLVVGKGSYLKKYKEQVNKLSLNKNIIFTGRRMDVKKLMNACDIFFLPSRGEGLPGVIMEASALKTPTVASDIPCIPDLVKHDESGFLAGPEDVDSFVYYLEMLIKDENLRKRMGESAFQHIQKYDWNKIVFKYEKLYEKLI